MWSPFWGFGFLRPDTQGDALGWLVVALAARFDIVLGVTPES
jgi:hypothetical protein